MNKDIKKITIEVISNLSKEIAKHFTLDQDSATLEILKALNSNIINGELYKQISYNLGEEMEED